MRSYTAQQKADALQIYVTQGLAAAAKATGFNKATICSWARRGGIQGPKPDNVRNANAWHQAKLEERRVELRGEMLRKAADLLQRMDEAHIDFKGKEAVEVEYPIAPAAAVRDYANAFGILIDKFRLEMGEVTNRTEALSITDGLDPDTKRALRERLARSVRGESQPEGAADAAERAGTGVDPRTAPDPA